MKKANVAKILVYTGVDCNISAYSILCNTHLQLSDANVTANVTMLAHKLCVPIFIHILPLGSVNVPYFLY